MGVWKKRWKFLAEKEKTAESKSVQIVESAKTSVLSLSNMAEYCQSRGNLYRCNGPFSLNEHGYLYFYYIKILSKWVSKDLYLKNEKETRRETKRLDLQFPIYLTIIYIYLLYGKLCERAVCCEFCFMIGYPSGQDGAILPARECPQIKFRQRSSECTKVFSRWNYFLLR